MKNKRAIAVHFLIILLVGVFVFVVLAFMVPDLLGKSGTETKNLISGTGDYDNDGTANFFDRCVCESGDSDNEGCPPDEPLTGESAKIREELCKEVIKQRQK